MLNPMNHFINPLLLLLTLAVSALAGDWVNAVATDKAGGICVSSGRFFNPKGQAEFAYDTLLRIEWSLQEVSETGQQVALLERGTPNDASTLSRHACLLRNENTWDVLLMPKGRPSSLADWVYLRGDVYQWFGWSVTNNQLEGAGLIGGCILANKQVNIDIVYNETEGYHTAFFASRSSEPSKYWAGGMYLGVQECYGYAKRSPADYYYPRCYTITGSETMLPWSLAEDARKRLWVSNMDDSDNLKKSRISARAVDGSWTHFDLPWPALEIVPRDSDWVEFYSTSMRKHGVVVPQHRAMWKNGVLTELPWSATAPSVVRCPVAGRCWEVDQTLASGKATLYRVEGETRTRSYALDTLVLDLSEDHEGVVWLGTVNGLQRLDTLSGALSTVFTETPPVALAPPQAASRPHAVTGAWVGGTLRATVPGPGRVTCRGLDGRLLAVQTVSGTVAEFRDLGHPGLVFLEWTP